MSFIKSHDAWLRGMLKNSEIVLRPTSDADIPLLCELNSDPKALALSSDTIEPYTEQTVRDIWGYVSKDALCFIVEVDGVPVGDCWLQKMNLDEVIARYPACTDIRCIDMSIGKVDYWNRGIGTKMVGMLVDYAFNSTKTDVLHCMCDSSNIRRNRVWEKNGFHLAWQCESSDYENHYALWRAEYFARIIE